MNLIANDMQLGLSFSDRPSPKTAFTTLSLKDSLPPVKFSTQDLAVVLTSIEGERYRKLKDLDYVHWLEGNQASNPVSLFIVENRKLGYWAERSILKSHDQSQRTENLNYFLLTIKVSRPSGVFSLTS